MPPRRTRERGVEETSVEPELPRRRPGRPPRPRRRVESSTQSNAPIMREEQVEPPRVRRRVPQDREDEEDLRQEIRELQREVQELRQARQEPHQVPIPPQPNPPGEPVARQEARRMIEEEGVSMFSFLKLGLPEFKGGEGEEPHEFLEQVEKVIRRLPCSDARAIELIGLLLKDDAWNWFKDHVEEQLYSEAPPTWEWFKQRMMDEFLTEGERESRIAQFEQLKQKGKSVPEYAKEFNRLSRFAKSIVPTEAAKINRFRRGLNAPLHNALCAIEFTSLTKLIDKTKQMEAKYKEDRTERDQRRKDDSKGQSRRGKGGEGSPQGLGLEYGSGPTQSQQASSESHERGQSGMPEMSDVERNYNMARRGRSFQSYPNCIKCGRKQSGECRMAAGVCLKCGQPGHFIKDCPQIKMNVPVTSQATVQQDRGESRGDERRGKGDNQGQTLVQEQVPRGRGQGRVFTLNLQDKQAPDQAVTGMVSNQDQLA